MEALESGRASPTMPYKASLQGVRKTEVLLSVYMEVEEQMEGVRCRWDESLRRSDHYCLAATTLGADNVFSGG
jgi:hypothetical protein